MSKKFVPRERKHRKLARQKEGQNHSRELTSDHANAIEIVPLSKSEQEERRRKLQDQIKAQQPDKISSKKRKRLDKYIDAKLKKEENFDLIKKISQQNTVDSSLLQSSRKLGHVHESKRERFARAIRERDAGINDGESVLFERRGAADSLAADLETEHIAHAPDTTPEPSSDGAAFGAGLKRPLDTNEEGRPVIKRRKRRKTTRAELSSDVESSASDSSSDGSEGGSEAESEWEGFESDHNAKVTEAVTPGDYEDTSEGSEEKSDDDEDDSGAESDDDESEEFNDDKPARVSAFKAWADSQRNEAVGFTPSAVPVQSDAIKSAFKPRAPSPDPVADAITSVAQNGETYRPQAAVTISRSEDIQTARLELPVVQEEQKIMEAINNNSVTIVCGATGSGKTTQLPQMLLENGYGSDGMIGITQPRRVAAVSVASRVAHELGSQHGKQVAHQVRYDSNVGFGTKIKFMTDGILLREISQDFALSKYSAVVIDEAHERSVNTDILIGMLSRIVPLRHDLSKEQLKQYKPLKLVIMSATLRVADFLMNARLFKTTKPPIVEAEGRQYSVTEHFARRTQRDYVAEMVQKVSKGHRKLPPGGILVFLTGQDEIQSVAKQLKEEFARSNTSFMNAKRPGPRSRSANDYMEQGEDGDDSDAEITGLDDYDDGEDAEFDDVEPDPALPRKGALKAHILPLYAALPSNQQLRVFKPAPEGTRSIVLATNVAETSLTIPGVRYVFDCGRSKEKRYDTATGVQEFKIDWISKASASQRMGRAGRTGPGHCYRLYSSAIYEQYFEEHTLPEILRTPIEGTVLQLKTMNVDNVVNFPFPTPPQGEQLAQAERLLKNIGAINPKDGKVTDVGQELIHYPVNPRFGKMLLLGMRNNVLAYTIALVAGLAVGDLSIPEPQALSNRNGLVDDEDDEDDEDQDILDSRKQAYGRAQKVLSAWDDKADVLKLLTAVAAYAQVEAGGIKAFCVEYSLREKGMAEVQQQRRQLQNIMQDRVKDPNQAGVTCATSLPPPSQKDINLLKQLVAAGYIDQVAIRGDKLPNAVPGSRKPTRAGEVPYRTLLPSIAEVEIDRTGTPAEQEEQRSVYVHGSSVLARLSPREMPEFVVYSHLSRREAQGRNRTRMHALTTVSAKQLAALADGTPLLEVGKPLGRIEDRDGGRRRECWVRIAVKDPRSTGEGWPLAPWKVVQVKKGLDWVIEKVIDRGR